MKKSFDTFNYINELGKDLIRDFDKAGQTTHPHSVGGGREKSAIDKLKDILPEGIGVGSGFIIDSFGNVSGQCDIILYEKNLCLKFNNNDSENCYYNCESVLDVGEVKSDLYKKDLLDFLQKTKKIKNLIRKISSPRTYRFYSSISGFIGTEDEKFDQFNKGTDQIFTFLICNSFKIKKESIFSSIKDFDLNLYEYPNCIISVEGNYIGYCKETDKSTNTYTKQLSSLTSDKYYTTNTQNPFGQLLDLLFEVINIGRTVSYNPRIYILKNEIFQATVFPID